MRPPITYYGGKTKMVHDIGRLYVQTGRYVEPFAGGASFFWHKQPSQMEVLCDMNGMVTNFYRMLKSPKSFNQLVEMVEGTLHSEFVWEEARWIYFHPSGYSKVERAWAFWVLFNMSFGGMGHHGAFQITCHNNDSWLPSTGIKNKRDQLKYYGNRLEKVMILTKNALTVIPKFDEERTFYYLDPPYWQADQGHYGGYTLSNFERLLTLCAEMKGKFLLSSYNCELLEQFTKENGWNTQRIDKALLVNSAGNRKIEVLTYNYNKPITKKPQLISMF